MVYEITLLSNTNFASQTNFPFKWNYSWRIRWKCEGIKKVRRNWEEEEGRSHECRVHAEGGWGHAPISPLQRCLFWTNTYHVALTKLQAKLVRFNPLPSLPLIWISTQTSALNKIISYNTISLLLPPITSLLLLFLFPILATIACCSRKVATAIPASNASQLRGSTTRGQHWPSYPYPPLQESNKARPLLVSLLRLDRPRPWFIMDRKRSGTALPAMVCGEFHTCDNYCLACQWQATLDRREWRLAEHSFHCIILQSWTK